MKLTGELTEQISGSALLLLGVYTGYVMLTSTSGIDEFLRTNWQGFVASLILIGVAGLSLTGHRYNLAARSLVSVLILAGSPLFLVAGALSGSLILLGVMVAPILLIVVPTAADLYKKIR